MTSIFLKSQPSKKGSFQPKEGSFGYLVYIYNVYIYIYIIYCISNVYVFIYLFIDHHDDISKHW